MSIHRMEYTKRLVLKCWHDSRIVHTHRVSCVACFFGDYLQWKYETYQPHYRSYYYYTATISGNLCVSLLILPRGTHAQITQSFWLGSLSPAFSRCNPFDIPCCYCCFLIFRSDIVYSIHIQWHQIEGEMETCYDRNCRSFSMGAYIIKYKL